ncbi:MAG: hypothetical protein AAGF56_04410 [Pseudomonadota bacterium]
MSIFELPTYFYICLAAALCFDVWRLQFLQNWTLKNIVVVNAFLLPIYLIFVVVMVSPGVLIATGSANLMVMVIEFVVLLAAIVVWAFGTGLSILFGMAQFVFLCLGAIHAYLGGEAIAFLMFATPIMGFFFPAFADFEFYIELGSGIIFCAMFVVQGGIWLWSQR